MDERAQEVPRDPDVGPQTFDPGPQPAGLVHRKSATVLSRMASFEEASIGAPRLAKAAQAVKCQRQGEQQAIIAKRHHTESTTVSGKIAISDSQCTPQRSSSARAASHPEFPNIPVLHVYNVFCAF